MHELTLACDDFIARDLPRFGGGCDEHLAYSGARHPHAVDARSPNTHASASNLDIECLCGTNEDTVYGGRDGVRQTCACGQQALHDRVVGEVADRRCFLEAHPVPVGIQLIREHLGECRSRALAHLRVRNNCGDPVICIQLHPSMNECLVVIGHERGELRSAVAGAQCNANSQAPADE